MTRPATQECAEHTAMARPATQECAEHTAMTRPAMQECAEHQQWLDPQRKSSSSLFKLLLFFVRPAKITMYPNRRVRTYC